jgi:hypothetical protein
LQSLRTKERENNKVLQTRGELSEADKAIYDKMRKVRGVPVPTAEVRGFFPQSVSSLFPPRSVLRQAAEQRCGVRRATE